MSNNSAHPSRNFSRFDAMSTEELKEILYQDSLLPADEETDMDAILYIMEVVAKREALEDPEASPSVEESWKSFNEQYRSEDCDGTSLYEDPEENAAPKLTAVPGPATEHSNPRKRLRSVLRVACTAAALLIVLMAGSLVAYASGFDLWGAVAQWTKDTFGFTEVSTGITPKSMYSADNDPRDALKMNGIDADLVPTWMPDGYFYKEMEIVESPVRTVFYIWYTNNMEEIGMTIALVSDSTGRTYEKEEQDATIYTVNNIDHYIVQNMEETTIAWTVGIYECSIGGRIPVEDAEKIIDSIYRS